MAVEILYRKTINFSTFKKKNRKIPKMRIFLGMPIIFSLKFSMIYFLGKLKWQERYKKDMCRSRRKGTPKRSI